RQVGDLERAAGLFHRDRELHDARDTGREILYVGVERELLLVETRFDRARDGAARLRHTIEEPGEGNVHFLRGRRGGRERRVAIGGRHGRDGRGGNDLFRWPVVAEVAEGAPDLVGDETRRVHRALQLAFDFHQ